MRFSHRWALATACAVAVSGSAWAQQNSPPSADRAQVRKPAEDASSGAVKVTHTYRSSTLVGMEVRNPEGQDLGSIEDLVIDMESQRVRYAALSFGGFLGLGDKLFAVPIQALTLKHDEDDNYFVLDVPKEKLETAPGFDKDAWPDFGNPEFGAEVDAFYGTAQSKKHRGTVVSAAEEKLVMRSEAGEEHSHVIGPNVQITLDGDEAEMDDLARGQSIEVTTAEREGKQVVTEIAARSSTAARTQREAAREE
jgi:sporulation protein YlmC with PRC-barrel domain